MNISDATYSPFRVSTPAPSGQYTNTNTAPDTDKTNQTQPTQQEAQSSADKKTSFDTDQTLTQAELRLVNELKQTDREVKQHEMAHIAAGGRYITSGANFTYKRGPDGQNYAVGGEVSIDTSPVPGDPQATIDKMRQIRSAALAPATPSLTGPESGRPGNPSYRKGHV